MFFLYLLKDGGAYKQIRKENLYLLKSFKIFTAIFTLQFAMLNAVCLHVT